METDCDVARDEALQEWRHHERGEREEFSDMCLLLVAAAELNPNVLPSRFCLAALAILKTQRVGSIVAAQKF